MSDRLLDMGGEWRRLHPLSPLVRSWRVVFIVPALAVQEGPGAWVGEFAAIATAAVVVLAGLGYWLAWRFTRYRLDAADLVVETGVVMRRSRRVPLARLQAIDVVRPLVARVLGLAELRLEVAGGSSSEATLAFLDEGSAGVVRNELLTLAAGLHDDVASVPVPTEAAEQALNETPSGILLASTVLTGQTLAFVAYLLSVVVGALASGEAALLGLVLPSLFAGWQVFGSFIREFGATIAESADGLRIRRGLLETRFQTVVPGRVQGLVVLEPLVWRVLGWVRLVVTIAGYGGNDERSATLVPVARRPEGRAVAARVLADANWIDASLSPAPRRAQWRAPVEAGRLGVAVPGQRAIVTRRGRFGQRTDVVPLARAQSVRLRQGPIQRRLRLATVIVDISPGPVRAKALHRDALGARLLLDEVVVAAGAARDAANPDRWLSAR